MKEIVLNDLFLISPLNHSSNKKEKEKDKKTFNNLDRITAMMFPLGLHKCNKKHEVEGKNFVYTIHSNPGYTPSFVYMPSSIEIV